MASSSRFSSVLVWTNPVLKPDRKDHNHMKRRGMNRTVGLALGVLSMAPCWLAQGATEETMTLDVAVDCRVFGYNRGVPLEQIVRGDGYIISGKVFPAGTLRPGPQTNDPNAPGSIGVLVSRGTTNATLAEHIANPNVPG